MRVDPGKNVIVTDDGRYYEKPSKARTVGAFIAGNSVYSIPPLLQTATTFSLMDKMRALNDPKDTLVISNALKSALEKSGLKNTVELIEYSGSKSRSFAEFIKKYINAVRGGKISKPKAIASFSVNSLKSGFNAGFVPIINQIHINTEKIGTAGFHEIGHAINFNTSKFWKAMQKSRFISMKLVIPTLVLVALCKRKKAEGEEPKGFFDKTTTFIKNNVGKLSFAAMIPVVAEEIKATARGNKLAKELLKPELYEKVLKTNKFGALSYICAAFAVSIGAYAANKARDAIAKPKEIKPKV